SHGTRAVARIDRDRDRGGPADPVSTRDPGRKSRERKRHARVQLRAVLTLRPRLRRRRAETQSQGASWTESGAEPESGGRRDRVKERRRDRAYRSFPPSVTPSIFLSFPLPLSPLHSFRSRSVSPRACGVSCWEEEEERVRKKRKRAEQTEI